MKIELPYNIGDLFWLPKSQEVTEHDEDPPIIDEDNPFWRIIFSKTVYKWEAKVKLLKLSQIEVILDLNEDTGIVEEGVQCIFLELDPDTAEPANTTYDPGPIHTYQKIEELYTSREEALAVAQECAAKGHKYYGRT
jgi:hypothetical protein